MIDVTRRHDTAHGCVDAPWPSIPDMQEETPFFPRGAVAFFGAMMIFYAAFWLLVMAIMVSRG